MDFHIKIAYICLNLLEETRKIWFFRFIFVAELLFNCQILGLNAEHGSNCGISDTNNKTFAPLPRASVSFYLSYYFCYHHDYYHDYYYNCHHKITVIIIILWLSLLIFIFWQSFIYHFTSHLLRTKELTSSQLAG